MALPILVYMAGTARLHGEPEATQRVIRIAMDPDLVRNAGDQAEAIEAFRSVDSRIAEIVAFDYFEISKWRYHSDFWRTRSMTCAVKPRRSAIDLTGPYRLLPAYETSPDSCYFVLLDKLRPLSNRIAAPGVT